MRVVDECWMGIGHECSHKNFHNVPPIRFIHDVKWIKSWVWSQAMSLRESTQSRPILLNVEKPSTRSGVGQLETNFVACLTRMGGPSQPCIGQSGI